MAECDCPAARGGSYPHCVEAHEGVPDLWLFVVRELTSFIHMPIDREAIEVCK